MRKAIEHAMQQAMIFAEYRDDPERDELSAEELKEIKDAYYHNPEVHPWETDLPTIRKAFRVSTVAHPYGSDGCDSQKCQCGDHTVQYVHIDHDNLRTYYCAMCAEHYLSGYIDALALADKNMKEFHGFETLFGTNFHAYPAWRPTLYPLFPLE